MSEQSPIIIKPLGCFINYSEEDKQQIISLLNKG